MINTHILTQEFEYLEPETIDEAVQYLAQYGERAKIIAGGTDLLVQMKMGKLRPGYLVNISRIPALRFLIEERGLRIGSLTPFREIEISQGIEKKFTALFEAARSVSSVQIKLAGTVGGNLCNASPAADSAPPLIAFGAKAKLVGIGGERRLPLEDFFVGPGETVLSPREILVEVEVPESSGWLGSSFLKMARVSADMAKVNVAVAMIRDGNVCKDCRIVLGSVAKTPLRVKKAEAILKEEVYKEAIVDKVCLQAVQEIQPINDIRSTAWYRKEVAQVMIRGAIDLAWKRAERGV
jgi:carbon-monoxide dehydrogenase medium subunit